MSAGTSTSSTSGRISSSARSTERAEPGPWWRIPRRCRLTASGSRVERTARLVEVVPPRSFPHDGFEVFTPHDSVVHRIADDGTDDACRDVGGAQFAVAEMGGEGEAVGDH